MSGKGFIEPHHSHLPRRTKKRDPSVPRRVRSDSFDSNKTEGGFESKDALSNARSPSRDADRQPVPPSSSPVSKQEIGRGSRVFVGFSGRMWKGESSEGGSDSEPDDEEEDTLKQRYSAIVRLAPGELNIDDDKQKGILRLSLPKSEPEEAGSTQLTARQIRLGCAFLHRFLSSSEDQRPVIILAPPSSAPDAFALGVCYHSGTVLPPSGRRPPSPPVPPLTPLKGDASNSDLPPEDSYTSIHQLVMKLHDEDLLVIDDEDGRRAGRGELKPGSAGLRNEWRGLLRYEGLQQLDNVWKPFGQS
ncbi:hypothetical protein EST38_g155 [Candolleomyces aberdarensis]|uniref:Uncharacterized protein n=1 Tax=Candolleomyces aberdarensis TaxID=2316362 RepID=A0A4Q2DZ80_9AGAR|nr:hypothetical protein EST38_g155 [Candolleomyces aberdarensis]